MAHTDPRVDAYIAKSAAFAQPILKHLRSVVHEFCPEVEETIKWGMPSFRYKGPFCDMAAFKQHCVFGLWKGALIVKDNDKAQQAMGTFGRITTLADLPSKKQLGSYLRAAMKLNDKGVKSPTRSKQARKPAPHTPADLAAALQKNAKARATYESFSPSHKREYVEWLVEAKSEATRARRLAKTMEWLSQGKSRNWQYTKRD